MTVEASTAGPPTGDSGCIERGLQAAPMRAEAREPQEQVIAGVLAERCESEPPNLHHRDRTQRQRAFAEWSQQVRSAQPPGRIVTHHTSAAAGETSRRYARMGLRRHASRAS